MSVSRAKLRCVFQDPPTEEKTVVSQFQFRLNGVIIPHIMVRPIISNGGKASWELVANDEQIGMFGLDDNEQLADPALPRFVWK